MKKAFVFISCTLLAAVLLAGCATLFGGGPQQKVTVSSDQPKASFLIKDQTGTVVFEGKDPGTLLLAKKYTYTVEVSLDGYSKQTIMISQGVNGWFWGNLCLGGIIGMGVDFITGSMWDLQPSNVSIKLHTAMAKTDTGYVVTFVTRDDKGELRSLEVELTKI
jgi:hypothetical protein